MVMMCVVALLLRIVRLLLPFVHNVKFVTSCKVRRSSHLAKSKSGVYLEMSQSYF